MIDVRSFQTPSLDEARAYVSRLFRSHYPRPVTRGGALQFSIRHREVDRAVCSAMFAYGVDIDIDVGRLEDFYALIVPLRGSVSFVQPVGELLVGVGEAAFVAPSAYLRSVAENGYRKLVIWIDRVALEDILGWDERRDTRLGTVRSLDFAEPFARALRDEIAAVHSVLGGDLAIERGAPEFALERLATALQMAVDPTDPCGSLRRSAADCLAGRAEAMMRMLCGEPIDVGDVAARLGVSRRWLFLAFQKARDYGPHTYLRQVRLESARDELCRGGRSRRTVTEVAEHWGFGHLGRFSADYRSRFGETPSETARAGRA